jgi:hypothetical protein
MEGSSICPVQALYDHCERTREYRENLHEEQTILLAFLHQEKLVTAANPATTAALVREVMAEAGIKHTIAYTS